MVSDAEVDDYLQAHPFDMANAEEMIGEQYWAATFMNWYESWSNWRRTGYPQLTPVNFPGNLTGGQIMRKLEYRTVEVANNPNVPTDQNTFMTRVWWDVN